MDPDGRTIWDVIDVAFAAMSVKDLVEEPSWENAGWATLDVAAIFPIVPSSGWFRRGADAASDAAKKIGTLTDIGIVGFQTFRAFKKAMGPAGPGMVWHHIVEQNKIGQFAATAVHSTQNIVRLPTAVHLRVNAIFSSIQKFTGGKVLREWLIGKSWEEQVYYGELAIEEAIKQMTAAERRALQKERGAEHLRDVLWEAAEN